MGTRDRRQMPGTPLSTAATARRPREDREQSERGDRSRVQWLHLGDVGGAREEDERDMKIAAHHLLAAVDVIVRVDDEHLRVMDGASLKRFRAVRTLAASRGWQQVGTNRGHAIRLCDETGSLVRLAYRRAAFPLDGSWSCGRQLTRGYQTDSSSKRPTCSSRSRSRATGPPGSRKTRATFAIDGGSLHISLRPSPRFMLAMRAQLSDHSSRPADSAPATSSASAPSPWTQALLCRRAAALEPLSAPCLLVHFQPSRLARAGSSFASRSSTSGSGAGTKSSS